MELLVNYSYAEHAPSPLDLRVSPPFHTQRYPVTQPTIFFLRATFNLRPSDYYALLLLLLSKISH